MKGFKARFEDWKSPSIARPGLEILYEHLVEQVG